jgi:hypothetical protein
MIITFQELIFRGQHDHVTRPNPRRDFLQHEFESSGHDEPHVHRMITAASGDAARVQAERHRGTAHENHPRRRLGLEQAMFVQTGGVKTLFDGKSLLVKAKDNPKQARGYREKQQQSENEPGQGIHQNWK